MKDRKPLAVGERVRVYESTGLFDGEVFHVFTDRRPEIRVRHSDGVRELTRDVFREQCRRLKPRKSKEEKGEEGRVRARVEFGTLERALYTCKVFDRTGSQLFPHYTTPAGVIPEGAFLTEMREGEAIVSRKQLAEASAWCDKRKDQIGNKNSWFENLCEALGLGDGEGKDA